MILDHLADTYALTQTDSMNPKIVIENPKEGRFTYNTFKRVEFVLFLLYAYRLLDVIVSGNVLTNSNVNRFNYFSEFSKLPFAQIIDYFSYPYTVGLWFLPLLFITEILVYLIAVQNKKTQIVIMILIALIGFSYREGVQRGHR